MSRASWGTLAPTVLLATPLGLVGCASSPVSSPAIPEARGSTGVVGVAPFDPGAALDTGRVVLDSHESFLMPLPDPSNRVPAYPEARLPDRLPPQQVCLLLAVAEDGRVRSVVDVTDRSACGATTPAGPDFVFAATQAARGWRFEPAVRCAFASAAEKAAAANTGCAGAREVPQAVSLHYRFVFDQVEGRGGVRVGP